MGSAKMYDDLAYQPKPDELYSQRDEQHGQQQRRTVRDPLAFEPLNQQHQAQARSTPQED